MTDQVDCEGSASLLGETIRERLRERNKTPRQASQAAGLNPSAVSNILAGSRPRPTTLEALSRVLGRLTD